MGVGSKTITLAGPATLAWAALAVAASANSLGNETPYDMGYAARAARSCPNVELLMTIDVETKAHADFQRGAAIFERYLELQSLDGACRAAMTLYDAKSGKVAKVLRVK